ncbi:hypothetical protein ACJMK2_016520 [Sinanodonta woodiana]|uniref:Poly [ADP-ribose] polymerase n=1 Tax=Sinanodonta woodiana TaxID=1069815 RepID=A0ABD3UTU5_SINWO
MPPKRKAAASKAGGKKTKKEENIKEEQEEEMKPKTVKDAIETLKAADIGKKKAHKPDSYFPFANTATVVDDYDCMLNQTNIGHNNNKFYVIQVLQVGTMYYSWNRWGRVGEAGANANKGPIDKASAIKDFEKKFSDKTKNKWANRDSFKPVPGKYTLIEMASEEDVVDAPTISTSTAGKKVKACTLDKETQELIKLIFDNDMFKDAMKNFDIDVKKMPLGKLSKSQIAKGFEVLDEIEKELNAKKTSKLNELSSRFYTVIPHDFGRKVPPVINDVETLRQKMDMLLVLGDIELAQSLQKEKDQAEKSVVDEVPHPLDVNYGLLKCKLELLAPKSKEFKILETYTENTKSHGWYSSPGGPKIKHIWIVDRDGEGSRFKSHDGIKERKLLWHGTNVAVVAAILKSGLRIMPHSGGRVGKGIYFASENAKSAGYVRPAGKTGIMFLNEVALGKEYHITMDDCSLTQPPSGYDSIVAKGQTEPDPSKDTILTVDGKKIVVPQGKPISQPAFKTSNFSQSEYLVYKESQNRIRYLLMMEF